MGQLLYLLGSFGPLIFGAFFLIFGIVLLVAFLTQAGWVALQSGSVRQMNAGASLFQAKRYAEAETHFRAILTRRLPAGIETDTRRRLADTLDILGKTDEAAEERSRASAVAMNSQHDPIALTVQGDILQRQYRYDEACEMYEQVLGLFPSVKSSGRALIMAKLAFAHLAAGRSSETLKWAESSLASKPAKDIHHIMEEMAAISSINQGDLEKAEIYYLRALKLAETEGKPEEISRSLAVLGNIQYQRGQFAEAIATCHRAWQTNPEPGRTALMVEANCLSDWGRFDEARAVMASYLRTARYDQPRLERKQQANGSIVSAYIEIVADRPEAALSYLEQAREGLKVAVHSTSWPPPPSGGEDKLVLWCDAACAYALAGTGQTDKARQLVSSVENRLPYFGQDRATRLGALESLGRAAFTLGDLVESRAFWLQYLDCKPNPVGLPSAYHWLGEIALRVGEPDDARDFFRQAVAPGIDSLDARRAKARLAEMGE